MSSRPRRRLTLAAMVLGLGHWGCGVGSAAAAEPAVPSRYRTLHEQIERALDGWARHMDRQRRDREGRPVWGAQLLAANANRGEQLLRPDALSLVRLFLDRFVEIGFGGVTLSVNYPLLDPDFPRAEDYEAFYREVAREVRQRGLALEVESGILFANTAFSTISFDYRALSWERLVEGRRAHTAALLRATSPDHLNIGAEPDTEARLAGHARLADPRARAEMIRTVLTGLERGRTRVSAGIGSWGDRDVVKAYIEKTDLDEISLHVYPIGRRTLATLYAVVEMARKAGKPVIVDECWLYKAGPGEGQTIAANETIFIRDLWSFWALLDGRFLGLMDRMARQEGVVWVSPFWTHQLFTYLDYDPALDGRSYGEVQSRYLPRVLDAAEKSRLSSAGESVKQLLARER